MQRVWVFNPWSGSWEPTCLVAKKPKHKTEYCSKFNKDFKNGSHKKNLYKNKTKQNKQKKISDFGGYQFDPFILKLRVIFF